MLQWSKSFLLLLKHEWSIKHINSGKWIKTIHWPLKTESIKCLFGFWAFLSKPYWLWKEFCRNEGRCRVLCFQQKRNGKDLFETLQNWWNGEKQNTATRKQTKRVCTIWEQSSRCWELRFKLSIRIRKNDNYLWRGFWCQLVWIFQAL